jgi:hypothetical protein
MRIAEYLDESVLRTLNEPPFNGWEVERGCYEGRDGPRIHYMFESQASEIPSITRR